MAKRVYGADEYLQKLREEEGNGPLLHKCGHSASAHRIVLGAHDQIGGTLCPDCFARYNAKNVAAAAYTEYRGWPALVGSERQVAWATTLRAQQVMMLERKISKMTSRASDRAQAQLAEMVAETDAAWWIRAFGGRK